MNVDIWQRWTVGMVTTRGVVAQMLTSDMGHKPQLAVEPGDVGLLWKADVYAHTP